MRLDSHLLISSWFTRVRGSKLTERFRSSILSWPFSDITPLCADQYVYIYVCVCVCVRAWLYYEYIYIYIRNTVTHNTLNKSSRLPVSAHNQAIVGPINYLDFKKKPYIV